MAQTLGLYLLNSALPKGHAFEGTVDNKNLQKTLAKLAKEDPQAYVKSVQEIKRLGDEFSTVEGVSVGLDDIAPDYASRDKILKPAMQKIKGIKDPTARTDLLIETQGKLRELAGKNQGDLGLMSRSGGRGNVTQLMKTVSGPVAVTDVNGSVVPWLIGRSYSEGLKPSEAWVAGSEARRSVIEGKTEVVEPGEVGKLMTQTMIDQVVTQPDCGTTNGILVPVTDTSDLMDRFLAKDSHGFKRNTLIDSKVANALKAKGGDVVVRSPLTCSFHAGGICQKCAGLDEHGQEHSTGVNIGVRAAQSLSEPLTQFSLSSKHATRLAKGKSTELEGIDAVKSLLEVPKSFLHAATLATVDGKVDSITAAPQGGHYIHISKTEHYVPPDLGITVAKGDNVEAGDMLSEGTPRPDQVVELRGLGVGRKYLVDKLHDVYKKAGVDIDKRHLELLARAAVTHVEVQDDPTGEFVRGDTVPFSQMRSRLSHGAESVSLDKAHGKVLAEDYLQYSAGTKVTPKVEAALRPHLSEVKVAVEPPSFKFIQPPIAQAPLLREDWLARLGHRYLKGTIQEGAQQGQAAEIHGIHPIPGLIVGTDFGRGPGGAY